jgi:hypothetical protein
MELFVQTTVNVVILAAVHILVSLGFAFLFNMLGILNLAHGAIYMIAGYPGYAFDPGIVPQSEDVFALHYRGHIADRRLRGTRGSCESPPACAFVVRRAKNNEEVFPCFLRRRS